MGSDILEAAGFAGKIFLRILSYIFNILLTMLLIGLITGTVVGCTMLYYVNHYIDADISAFDYVTTTKSTVSKIYYMDYVDRENRIGTAVELGDQRIVGTVDQTSVSYKDIPNYMWQAFVAIEDKRFFEHNGVDLFTSVNAVRNFVFGNEGGGGSTITQQLVKNITGDNQRTVQRKIQEWMRAMKLEKMYDKTEILEMYLNNIYLGQGCTGVQAAAFTYFGKDVSELTLAQCAAIASITQFPTRYDPIQHPENNEVKRHIVLNYMLEQGYITQAEHDEAYNMDIEINYKGTQGREDDGSSSVIETPDDGIYSWYTEAAIDEAKDLLVENLDIPEATASKLLYSQGYKIITCMDPVYQKVVTDYYEDMNNFARINDSAIQPESAFCLIDSKTGDVMALAGARGKKTANNILNYATMIQRSPGSSIKPLSVYGPALEYGLISYATVLDDTPVSFGEPIYEGGRLTGWSDSNGYPDNYDNKNRGRVTLNYAIENSLNTIAYKVLQILSLDKSFDFVKNKLHIDNFIEQQTMVNGNSITDKDYSALALGGMNYGVSVLEMTAAYQIFANDGVYNKPRIVLKILDSEGNVVVENEAESEIVISEQNASIMTTLLENVVTYGTAAAGITCDIRMDVAGKTGTTTRDNDRWFIGYTPYCVAGIWFGYSYPQSLAGFSAAVSPAVKAWDEIMTTINDMIIADGNSSGFGLKSFKLAQGVVQATFCKDSGKLMTDACRADPRGDRSEVGYFTPDTVPTEPCDCHVLVDYDKVNGGIANGNCQNTVKVGLLNITDRSFPCDIIVGDAQYVYYGELPAGVKPGATDFEPYFINMLKKNTYVGITGNHYTVQYNRWCNTCTFNPHTDDIDGGEDTIGG